MGSKYTRGVEDAQRVLSFIKLKQKEKGGFQMTGRKRDPDDVEEDEDEDQETKKK